VASDRLLGVTAEAVDLIDASGGATLLVLATGALSIAVFTTLLKVALRWAFKVSGRPPRNPVRFTDRGLLRWGVDSPQRGDEFSRPDRTESRQ
jgi:hypothetical protein